MNTGNYDKEVKVRWVPQLAKNRQLLCERTVSSCISGVTGGRWLNFPKPTTKYFSFQTIPLWQLDLCVLVPWAIYCRKLSLVHTPRLLPLVGTFWICWIQTWKTLTELSKFRTKRRTCAIHGIVLLDERALR